MSLDERSRELGRLIGQSSEYQTMKRASQALHADQRGAELMREMEKLQRDAQSMIERNEVPGAEMEKQLDALLTELQTRHAYQEMVVAQENFDKVMHRVNEWILEGIRAGAASPIITLG